MRNLSGCSVESIPVTGRQSLSNNGCGESSIILKGNSSLTWFHSSKPLCVDIAKKDGSAWSKIHTPLFLKEVPKEDSLGDGRETDDPEESVLSGELWGSLALSTCVLEKMWQSDVWWSAQEWNVPMKAFRAIAALYRISSHCLTLAARTNLTTKTATNSDKIPTCRTISSR